MSRTFLINLLRFILLAGVQVIVLNRIQFAGFINPLLYVLFILMLPFETPGWLLLIASFGMGLTIDAYSDTGGLHAAASTLAAFIRPTLLRLISTRQDYEPGMSPSLWDMGFLWFIKYASLMLLMHHLSFFILESGRFGEFHLVLYRTLLSLVFTLTLIILTQFLLFRARS